MTPGCDRQNPTPIIIAHNNEKTVKATAAADTANASNVFDIPHQDITI